jgi:hypothetical protein
MSKNQIRLSHHERNYLKQLVLECDVQRFSRQETNVYIRSRLGKDISDVTIDKARYRIKYNIESRVNHLRKHKTAFIEQFFRRIAEIEKYQKEEWNTLHLHGSDPYVRIHCIKELHQLTITLANLYEVLPAFIGTSLSDAYNIPVSNSETEKQTAFKQ